MDHFWKTCIGPPRIFIPIFWLKIRSKMPAFLMLASSIPYFSQKQAWFERKLFGGHCLHSGGTEWQALKAGESRQGWYGEGCPLCSWLGGLGERLELPRGVWGGALAGNAFWHILNATECSFLHLYAEIFGGQGQGLGAIATCPNVEPRLIRKIENKVATYNHASSLASDFTVQESNAVLLHSIMQYVAMTLMVFLLPQNYG